MFSQRHVRKETFPAPVNGIPIEFGGGFLIGCTLGVVVALATARWTIISAGLMPFAIAVNATPIIALALAGRDCM